jgi:hypothetical protein
MYIYPAQYRRYVLDCPLAGGHIYILNTSFGSKLGAGRQRSSKWAKAAASSFLTMRNRFLRPIFRGSRFKFIRSC